MTMPKDMSVVIPTYDRPTSLRRCLQALARQTLPSERFEVLLVDDGSCEEHRSAMERLRADIPVDLKIFSQPHKGPAAARNLAMARATGGVVLLLGDDILATPRLLEEHLLWHKKHADPKHVVLGYVTWDPALRITPFMRWCENGGPQFSFYLILDQVEIPRNFFTSCNVSIKRDFPFSGPPFDEEFPDAAYEDVELAFRMDRAGMKLFFNRQALAYHDHPMSLESACRRMIRVGESGVLCSEKIGPWGSGLKPTSLFQKLLSSMKLLVYYPLAKYYETRAIRARFFDFVLGYFHDIGVQAGLRKKRRAVS